jgi:hypothetical protein
MTVKTLNIFNLGSTHSQVFPHSEYPGGGTHQMGNIPV